MSDEPIRSQHTEGFEELNSFWDNLEQLETSLEEFSETALTFVEEPLERALETLQAFEPSVSIVGQIKAGKSMLLNALIGMPGLLPSDVNPWTSVITALHLNSRYRPMDTRAIFRFFDQHEWDRLVATGGRLGEMATRAGFETEAEDVRNQVLEMRQTTEDRLGDEFKTLIGTSHTYQELEQDTINRYICYGDKDDLLDGADEGVYADITKLADLYVDVEGLPKGLCFRDTPGVNDTFMMREQITLNAISESRVCVVVLSAHQALSTMDVAILRIICAVEAREVLIFVNRIDELEDPAGETDRITKSIKKTLGRFGIDDEVEILFGSGYWATFALNDDKKMLPRSLQSLTSLHPEADLTDMQELRKAALTSSGVTALHRAIVRRIVEGPGKALMSDMNADLDTIIEMSETVENAADLSGRGKSPVNLSPDELNEKLAEVLHLAVREFDGAVDDIRASLIERLKRAQSSFVGTALEALQSHINVFGETGAWDHDPNSLRMMMRVAFTTHCSKLRAEGENSFELVLDGVDQLLRDDFDVVRNGESIRFPEQPLHKAPTVLARTISLDLENSWWQRLLTASTKSRFTRKYWARRIEKKYRELIVMETETLITDIVDSYFNPAVDATRDIITVFMKDQNQFCHALLERINDESAPSDSAGQDTLDMIRKLSA